MKDTPSQVAAVQVAVRIRPLTDRDRALPRFANSTNQDVLRANENHVQIVPQNRYFTYDYVFGTDTEQQTIFSRLGEKPVERFIEGYNVTILAYGQTSSGKTYTMGTAQHTDSTVTFEEEGIIPRAMSLLFDMLNKQQQQQVSQTEPIEKLVKSIRPPSSQSVSQRRNSQQQLNSNHRYTLKVSFVEIYNEELVDLLNSSSASERPPITIREDTKGHIYWTGVKEMIVHNTSDVLNFLQQGTNNRATGSTDMNEKSSRSHAIFSVTLKQEKRAPSSTQSSRSQSPAPIKNQQSKSQRISLAARYSSSSNINHMNNNDDGEWIVTTSKFHFVDLAGSERLKRTAAEGDRRKEGININAGLLALGNVISALGDPSKRNTHVPYRDSKLTRLLQDSLGGSAMTLMIACVSPAESNLSETLNTLQYANRARNIKNKLEKNEMEEWMVTDNIDLLRTTITKLKNELRLLKSMNNANSNNNNLKLDNCTRHLSDTSDDFSLTSSSPVANPDPDDAYYGQHILIQDLQHQVEALQNEAEFAKERNIVVESELRRLHEERDAPNKYDFQHLVEPVIEEYEKSMSALESKLALAQAALSHSDQVHEELMTKIAYYEDTIEKLENVIQDLQRRIGKLLERRLKDENYITELEKKLMVSVEETIHDRELLSELRGKILKFKEVDETTEQYIQELENRLNISEAECNSLREEVKAMKATDKDTDTCKKPITNHDTVSNYKKEMDVLQQKNAASEQECQTLRAEVDKLLLELEKSTLPSQQIEAKATVAGEEQCQKDVRIQQLESNLMHLEQDHQDTLKELDEVLARYEEALEQVDLASHRNVENTEMNVAAKEEELISLRNLVQHLKHEVNIKSKRESLFRELAEKYIEPDEIERKLREINAIDDGSFSHTLIDKLDSLQKDYECLRSQLNTRNKPETSAKKIHELNALDGTDLEMHVQRNYNNQLLLFKQALKNLTRLLKEIKRIKANESKLMSNSSTRNQEQVILMKSIVSVDKQLTEQYEKLKIDAKRFSNDMQELLSLRTDAQEQQQEDCNRKSINADVTESNHSTEDPLRSTAVVQTRHSIQQAIRARLLIAEQDLYLYQTIITGLEHKFRIAQVSVSTSKRHLDDSEVTDTDIEELRTKMDAMKLQMGIDQNMSNA